LFLAEHDRRGLGPGIDFIEEEIEPAWPVHHELQVSQMLRQIVLAIDVGDCLDQPASQFLQSRHPVGITLRVVDLLDRAEGASLHGREFRIKNGSRLPQNVVDCHYQSSRLMARSRGIIAASRGSANGAGGGGSNPMRKTV
jgi:hypothetical protein